tara:strand:+ start:154 stop:525 length:372 start_codon:yes stop_codon:yes gene_type:complete
MKKCILIALITTSLFLLSNCSKYQQAPETVVKNGGERIYNNDFTTLEIRSFWAVCQQSFLQKNPYTPPKFIIEYCDCYSDHVRRTYKSMKELNSLKSYEELTKSLIIECNLKIQQELAPIDPA